MALKFPKSVTEIKPYTQVTHGHQTTENIRKNNSDTTNKLGMSYSNWKKIYQKVPPYLKEPRASLGYGRRESHFIHFPECICMWLRSNPNQILLTVERYGKEFCCQSNEGVKHRKNSLCYTWTLYKCTLCIFLKNEHFCI